MRTATDQRRIRLGLEWQSTEQRKPWRRLSRLFRLRSVGSLCIGVSEKGSGSFKLPSAGAISVCKIGFSPADLQRQQAPKREMPVYGPYRGSHSEWPKRDAAVGSNTLWEQD